MRYTGAVLAVALAAAGTLALRPWIGEHRVCMHWLSVVRRTLLVLRKLLERGGFLVAHLVGFGRCPGAFHRRKVRLTKRSKLI